MATPGRAVSAQRAVRAGAGVPRIRPGDWRHGNGSQATWGLAVTAKGTVCLLRASRALESYSLHEVGSGFKDTSASIPAFVHSANTCVVPNLFQTQLGAGQGGEQDPIPDVLSS